MFMGMWMCVKGQRGEREHNIFYLSQLKREEREGS